MYNIYPILGNIAMVLLFSQLALFVFRRIFRYTKSRSKRFSAFLKFLRSLHIATGISLLIVGLIHGILALGRFQLHTGWILWFVILYAFVGFLLKDRIGRKWVSWHRIAGFALIGLFFLHRFFPWII
ncbi:MAG: hypothetical protein N2380_06190 [bacterium]|nr:hypothetical protein [bacterium]